jgi:hypothetical protein
MRRRNHNVVIAGVMAVAGVLVSAANLSGAIRKIHHVPRDYATIQSAVAAAEPGDTILVAAGIYSENVVISTPGVRLLGGGDVVLDGAPLGGAGKGIHVLGASAAAPVSGVEVSKFEVRNFERGITLEWAIDARVTHNYVHDNVDLAVPAVLGDGFGIELTVATSSDVSHNVVSSNGFGGVRVGGFASTGNTIHHNRIVGNGTHACQVCHNSQGILVTGPSNNNQIVFNEIAENNGRGVIISRPLTEAPVTGILVAHNRLYGNHRAGVFLSGAATGITVEYNDARENNVFPLLGPDRRCNLFDNSVGSTGGNIFSNNHGTYSVTDDCEIPLPSAVSTER